MRFLRRLLGTQTKEEKSEPAARAVPATAQPEVRLDPAQRVQRAVESILENEAVSQELDDDAAGTLLRWGTTWAQDLVQSTLDLDEEMARDAIAPRLRAVRRMMRAVSRWAANQEGMDEAGRSEALQKILDQAVQARGGMVRVIDEAQRAEWAARLADFSEQPMQAVAELQKLIDEIFSSEPEEPA